jgi:hypothetical protein
MATRSWGFSRRQEHDTSEIGADSEGCVLSILVRPGAKSVPREDLQVWCVCGASQRVAVPLFLRMGFGSRKGMRRKSPTYRKDVEICLALRWWSTSSGLVCLR